MDPSVLKKLNTERRAGRACVHLVEMAPGRDRMIRMDDRIPGALGAAVTRALKSGQSEMVTIDGADYFLNVHIPAT